MHGDPSKFLHNDLVKTTSDNNEKISSGTGYQLVCIMIDVPAATERITEGIL
jgi:hypothetical protein